MVETPLRVWASFVGGGVAAFLVTVPPIVLYEDAARVDVDQSVFPLAAILSVAGLAAAWRRAALRSAFAGAALLTAFFSLLLADIVVPAGALLLGAAVYVVIRAPAPVRMLLGALFLWAAMLVVATLASASVGFAPLSGLALAALGLAYPVAWALRERAPWARHLAWAAATAWSLLCLVVALVDVASLGDGLAVVSSLLLAGATAAVVAGWVRHATSRDAAPSFGST